MKKILLMSAFALLGSLAMANDTKLELTPEKLDITSVDVAGSALVITRAYGCNGEYLGSYSSHVDCPSCEGAVIIVNSTVLCLPSVVEEFPHPGF